MSNVRISRRQFLRVGATAVAGAALVACQPQTVVVEKEKIVTQVVEKEVTKIVAGTPVVEKVVETKVVEKEVTKIVEKEVTPTAAPVTYKESPLLSARVKSGQLVPVEERIPSDVMIIEPYEEIGQYGGTLRLGTEYTTLFSSDTGMAGGHPQQLLRISQSLREATPNVAKAYEMSEDGKVFTIHLRKGMKWSDGEPVTADNAMYWYEAILLNKDVTPIISLYLVREGKPVVVEKIDDYTFTYTFAGPHPTFVLGSLAHRNGIGSAPGHLAPGHYLEQYHIATNPKAEELAKAEKFDYWYQLYNRQKNPDLNKDLPIYRAFICSGANPSSVSSERNPFFWMVDTEGHQLPYIDKMATDRIADREMLTAKIVAGEYDFGGFNTNIVNYAAYSNAAQQHNFRILLWFSGKGAEVLYNWNMTFDDPTLRKIFQDARFRRALSLAINREEINSVIYFGRATARQMTVIPYSSYYKEEYARAWADYDPDQANALLDEIGLKWDDAHEVRLDPEGRPLKIFFEHEDSETPKVQITELVKAHWGVVGIEINPKVVTRTLMGPKVLANQMPLELWHGDGCTDILFTSETRWFAPIHYVDAYNFGPKWALWYQTSGKEGEEPPQYIKDLYDWIINMRSTLAPEWGHKILQAQADNVWTIGTVGMAPHPLVVRNNLRNVPDEGVWVWDELWSYPYFPEQWFLKT